jgi:hypothetical protein
MQKLTEWVAPIHLFALVMGNGVIRQGCVAFILRPSGVFPTRLYWLAGVPHLASVAERRFFNRVRCATSTNRVRVNSRRSRSGPGSHRRQGAIALQTIQSLRIQFVGLVGQSYHQLCFSRMHQLWHQAGLLDLVDNPIPAKNPSWIITKATRNSSPVAAGSE